MQVVAGAPVGPVWLKCQVIGQRWLSILFGVVLADHGVNGVLVYFDIWNIVEQLVLWSATSAIPAPCRHVLVAIICR